MPRVASMMGSDATAHVLWGYVMWKQHGAQKCFQHINLHVRIDVCIYVSIDLLELADVITAVDSRVKVVFHRSSRFREESDFSEQPDVLRNEGDFY